ncbi:unnamed protein product [Darwinula stevensoni]|uniref:Calcium-activated chloride channel N-terminal domain-containing protein n=1 Tax=Darwinula stevensoni TaxID=69355 RepID=A0A7R9ABG8_9CRUS|nr:unnamed protein product [Darwinula stevensoni]CAG0899212.1 unnamed protein product [Darwinula stevensoni]
MDDGRRPMRPSEALRVEPTATSSHFRDTYRMIPPPLGELFSRGSQSLFRATQRLAFFRSVEVLLPEHWEARECGLTNGHIRMTSWRRSQAKGFRVGTLHPSPFTLQPHSCGLPGEYVYLPLEFIRGANASLHADRVLVREWSKFRYGAFDETGFPNDPLTSTSYQSYSESGLAEPEPSICTDKQLTVTKACTEGECRFRVRDEGNEEVTASLMALPHLPNVEHYCDDSNHKEEAPTRHNILCDGRSTWDVVSKNADFLGISPSVANVTSTVPTFTFTKASPRKVVFVLQASKSIGAINGRWESVRSGIYRWLELVSSSPSLMVGFVEFAGSRTVKMEPVKSVGHLKLSSKSLISRYPSDEEDGQDHPACIHCALRHAFELLSSGSGGGPVGGEILLIAEEQPMNPRINDQDQLLQLVSMEAIDRGVAIHTLSFPGTAMSGSGSGMTLEKLSEETGGVHRGLEEHGSAGTISGRVPVANMVEVLDAIETVFPTLDSFKLYRETGSGTGASRIAGEFLTEAGLRELQMLVYYPSEDLAPKRVLLQDPHGSTHDVIGSPLASPNYNADILRIRQWDPIQVGQWRYEIETVSAEPVVIEVRGFPSSRRDAIRVRTWTSWDGSRNPDPRSQPLILFAEVTRGGKVLRDAVITAHIQRKSLTFTDELSLTLLDDGMGDPDMIRGDGVYSAYFTHFAGSQAKYSMSYTASDGGGKARYLQGQGQRPSEEVPTGPFHRILPGPIIFVRDPPLDDIYPPNRILDLRVQPDPDEPSTLVLTWTSPGANYNHGRADRYELRYAADRSSLRSETFPSAKPVSTSTPLPRGSREELRVGVGESGLDYDRVFYFAIRAFHGRWSRVSNVVKARLPPPPAPPTTVPASVLRGEVSSGGQGGWAVARDETAVGGAGKHAKLIVIIGGCVSFVIVLTVLVLCVTICVRRRQEKKQDPKSPPEPKSKSPDVISPVSSEKEWGVNVTKNGSPEFVAASDILGHHAGADLTLTPYHMTKDESTSTPLLPDHLSFTYQSYDIVGNPPPYSHPDGSSYHSVSSVDQLRSKYVHFSPNTLGAPPVPPKPSLYGCRSSADYCGLNESQSSVGSSDQGGKKVRTVTQV